MSKIANKSSPMYPKKGIKNTDAKILYKVLENNFQSADAFLYKEHEQGVDIKYKETGHVFKIVRVFTSRGESMYHCQATNFNMYIKTIRLTDPAFYFNDIAKQFGFWLQNVIAKVQIEAETINPWTELHDAYEASKTSTDEETYSEEEVEPVKAKLDSLPQLLIQCFEIQHEQIEEVKKTLQLEMNEIKVKIDNKENKTTVRKAVLGTVVEFCLKYGIESIPKLVTLVLNYFSNAPLELPPDKIDTLSPIA